MSLPVKTPLKKVTISIRENHLAVIDDLCARTNLSRGDVIGYLIDFHKQKYVPEKPSIPALKSSPNTVGDMGNWNPKDASERASKPY